MKPKKLKSSYAVVGERTINGYRQQDLQLKMQFLRDARAWLMAAAKPLLLEGWTLQTRSNPAGPAVSGDVYLDIKRAEKTNMLHITVTASLVRDGLFTRDRDGVCVYAQYQSNDMRRAIIGANTNIDPDLDSGQLEYTIRKMLKAMP